MKNSIFLSTITLFCCIANSSCQRENDYSNLGKGNNGIPSVLTFYKAMTEKNNGQFGLSIHSTFGQPIPSPYPAIVDFQGAFYTNEGNVLKGGDVKISNQIFRPDAQNNNIYYGNLSNGFSYYGKKVEFSLRKPANFTANRAGGTTSDEQVDSLYVPTQIFLTSSYDNQSSVEANRALPGVTTLNWNTDTANHKGVIIIVEYSTGLSDNVSLVANGYNQNITNGVSVIDNGTTVLSQDLFAGIPAGAVVHVMLVRANYRIILDSNNVAVDFTLYAYSQAEGLFKY